MGIVGIGRVEYRSVGDAGSAGVVRLWHNGNITTSGPASNGIFAQSRGDAGHGNITINLFADSVVRGGAGSGAAVRLKDGSSSSIHNYGAITSGSADGWAVRAEQADPQALSNHLLANYGTITGDVSLDTGVGGGVKTFVNSPGAVFNSGIVVSLRDGTFSNSGVVSPGGTGMVQTTFLFGNLQQGGFGSWIFDINFDSMAADSFSVIGAASLFGNFSIINLNNHGSPPPGSVHVYDLITASDGLTTGTFGLGKLTGDTGVTYELISSPTKQQVSVTRSSGDFYWRGGPNGAWNGELNGVANWTSDLAGTSFIHGTPGPASDVFFSSANIPAFIRNTTLGADYAIKSLTINDSNQVNIFSGPGAVRTLTIAGDAGTGIDVQSGAGAVLIGANVTLSGGSDTVTVNNDQPGVLISGVVGGNNGLTKAVAGRLVLTGMNNYTGGTTISAGRLQVGLGAETGSLGSGPVTNDGDLINVLDLDGLFLEGGSFALTDAGGLAAGAYTLIDYEGILGGGVANLSVSTTPTEFSYSLFNNASSTSIDLMVSAISLGDLPGDFDLDFDVDGTDFLLSTCG